jgi:hypothetical protein
MSLVQRHAGADACARKENGGNRKFIRRRPRVNGILRTIVEIVSRPQTWDRRKGARSYGSTQDEDGEIADGRCSRLFAKVPIGLVEPGEGRRREPHPHGTGRPRAKEGDSGESRLNRSGAVGRAEAVRGSKDEGPAWRHIRPAGTTTRKAAARPLHQRRRANEAARRSRAGNGDDPHGGLRRGARRGDVVGIASGQSDPRCWSGRTRSVRRVVAPPAGDEEDGYRGCARVDLRWEVPGSVALGVERLPRGRRSAALTAALRFAAWTASD